MLETLVCLNMNVCYSMVSLTLVSSASALVMAMLLRLDAFHADDDHMQPDVHFIQPPVVYGHVGPGN